MGFRKIWPVVRPSTRAFWREARRTPHFTLVDMLHGYVYGRWPYLYISLGIGERPWPSRLRNLATAGTKMWRAVFPAPSQAQGTFADGYHGKVLPLEKARQLVTVREEIHRGDLERVIPYPMARDLILKNPDHIAVIQCPCRAARLNPCTPLDVCLIVGEPFASFVVEHNPQRARWIDAVEAQSILEAEERRGHVHHAFFKDAMLGRFYAICNCCPCCCGAIQSHRNGIPMLAPSGYRAEVTDAVCIACGACESACPFGAITVVEQATIQAQSCMGCGVCAQACPQEAIQLVLDPSRGIPLEIIDLATRI